MLTIKEAVEYCGVSRMSIYNAIKTGKLKAVEKYGKKLFRKSDLDAYKETIGTNNGYLKRASYRNRITDDQFDDSAS